MRTGLALGGRGGPKFRSAMARVTSEGGGLIRTEVTSVGVGGDLPGLVIEGAVGLKFEREKCPQLKRREDENMVTSEGGRGAQTR